MNLPRIYLFAILLLALGVDANGQNFDADSNWFKEIGRGDDYYSRFDFTRYTKDDIQIAKRLYLKIASVMANDEWTGTYRRETALGSAEITWDRQNGFVYSYVYHTLANIDYGRVKSVGDLISFVPERPKVRKRAFELDLVQVKFGEKHLLVPKNGLADFAIWAAGREVASDHDGEEIYTEDGFFWEKVTDKDKKIADVPTLPKGFAHLVRKPIRTKVQAVGSRNIRQRKSRFGEIIYEESVRLLTFSSGAKQGIKVGMRFWIDDLEEWAEIVSISVNRSVAELSRPIIDDKEFCDRYENYSQVVFPCRNPKIGTLSRTKTQYF